MTEKESPAFEYDPNYTEYCVVSAEGQRVGLTTCKRCGAAILLAPGFGSVRQHSEFHRRLENE